MSAFSHGFKHGFNFGMFNGMFGGGWCNPFGNPFIGNHCNPFIQSYTSIFPSFNNCTSLWSPGNMFMVPSCNLFTFTPYESSNLPMPNTWNVKVPDFTTTPTWQNYNYSIPTFTTPSFTSVGDTFTKTTGGNNFVENKTTTNTITTPSETKSKATTKKKSTNNNSNLKAKHWTEMSDAEMREIYGGYTRDITVKYRGTAEDLNKYLKGKGKLEGKGQAFIDAQNKYGISASVLVGIAMNESGGGKSRLARQKNNVGGVRISGSNTFKSFSSVEECIDYMASFLKRNYVNNSKKPLTKLYQINAKYCPTADPTDKSGNNSNWARAVDKYSQEVENAIA